METILYIVIVVLIIGLIAVIAYMFNLKSELRIKSAELETMKIDVEKRANEIQEDFKLKQKENEISLKEKLHQKRNELEAEMRDKRNELNKLERRLTNKEDTLDNKTNALEKREKDLNIKEDQIIDKEDHLADLIMKQTTELERISGISSEEAKKLLLTQLEDDLKVEINQIVREYENQT